MAPKQNDILIASIGDDTLYGDGGNDRLEGGFGNDIINAGDGDDIVVDSGGDDNIKAGEGHDVVHAGPGLDLVMGNDGQDFIFLGTDMGSEVFAGTGNDFIYGNKNAERILGNEGDDWIETGTFDGAPGDNFDEVFSHDEIDGNDVFLGDGGFDEFIGEGGDEIFVGSPGRGKMVGMSGFDWATYKDNAFGVNADLSIPIVFDEAPTLPQNAALDEYESVEGLSGTKFDDVLKGSNTLAEERFRDHLAGRHRRLSGQLPGRAGHRAHQRAAGRAGCRRQLLQRRRHHPRRRRQRPDPGQCRRRHHRRRQVAERAHRHHVGLQRKRPDRSRKNVRARQRCGPGDQEHDQPGHAQAQRTGAEVATGGTLVTKPLSAWMFEGRFNPGQLQIIREIKIDDDRLATIDTAAFQGARGEYAFSATADGQVIVTHAIENSSSTAPTGCATSKRWSSLTAARSTSSSARRTTTC